MRSLKRFAQEPFFSRKILTRLSKIRSLEVGLFLSMFIVSLFLNFSTQKYRVPNTDINQIDLFSDLLIKNQTLRYENGLNEEYGVLIFGIRSLLNFGGNYFVPSVLPGIIMIQSSFKFVNLPTFLINPVFVLVTLWFFNKIVSSFIFNERFWSLSTTVIFFSSGAFIFVSSLPFKDLVATSTFFAGLYYLLNGIYDKKAANFALFGFFAGVTMWINYPNVLFYLPALGLYLLTVRNEMFKKQNLKNLIICFMFFLPLFVSLYVYQVSLFGSFLGFYNPAFSLNHYEEFNIDRGNVSSFIFNVNAYSLVENFYNQFFLVNLLLISLSIFGFLIIVFDILKGKKANGVLSVMLMVVAMQFFFYLGKTWSGVSYQGCVGTSYSRYLLISWGVLVILSVYSVKRILNSLNAGQMLRKRVLALLIIYLIVSGFAVGLGSKMAVGSWIETSEWAIELRNDLINNTPENSVIFTSFYDKFLYPARQTAIYVAIPEGERTNKTLTLMRELLEDGYPVYIVDERDSYAISPVLNEDEFENNKLETELAFSSPTPAQIQDIDFYRITISKN